MTQFSFRGVNPLACPSLRLEVWVKRVNRLKRQIEKISETHPRQAPDLHHAFNQINDAISDKDVSLSAGQIGTRIKARVVTQWLREEIEQLEKDVYELTNN